jgi:hypothetical protein
LTALAGDNQLRLWSVMVGLKIGHVGTSEGAGRNPTEAQQRVRSTLHYLGSTNRNAERYRACLGENHGLDGIILVSRRYWVSLNM